MRNLCLSPGCVEARCFGGFRQWRITLRSFSVGGYFLWRYHGLSPWGSIFGILQASGWGRQCYSRKASAPVGVFFSRVRIRITCKILENVTQLLTCEVGIFFY